MNLKENRVRLSILVQFVLCMGLVFVVYLLAFKGRNAFSLGEDRQSSAASTRTAIAATIDALMGPFPTATLPTKTASPTHTATPRISATPTLTASATLTPSRIPTRFLSPTSNHGTDLPSLFSAPTFGVPTLIPTRTLIVFFPTNTPQPTIPPAPTKVSTSTPTYEPAKTPTRAPTKTHQPTKTSAPTPQPTNTNPPPATNTDLPQPTEEPTNPPPPTTEPTNPPPEDTPTDPPAVP